MTEDRPQYGKEIRAREVDALITLIQEQAQHADTLRLQLSVATPRTIERLHDFFASCQKQN